MPAKCEHIRLVCVECGAGFSVEPYRATKAKTCGVACRQRHNARFSGEPQRYRGNGKTYVKYHGRHLHRVLAEQKIGRALIRGEVVHHINGNIRDNRLENIEVLPSQSEHVKKHFGKGGRWRSL